jgi:TorA maturation chaperone TorD
MRKILVVSSSPMFGQRLELLIASATPYEAVSAGLGLDQAIEQARALNPYAILVDNSQLFGSEVNPTYPLLELNIPVIELNLKEARITLYKEGEVLEYPLRDIADNLVSLIEPRGPDWGTLPNEELAHLARLKASAYAFLVAGFSHTPDIGLLKNFPQEPLADQREGLQGPVREGLARIRAFLDQVRDLEEEEIEGLIKTEYERLFRGPKAPNESNFRGSVSRFAVMRVYELEGVSFEGPSDSLACELDFLRFLVEREATAWEGGNKGLALSSLQAQQAFLTDHVLRWAPECLRAMEAEALLGFYKGLMRLTLGFLEEEAPSLALKLARLQEEPESTQITG